MLSHFKQWVLDFQLVEERVTRFFDDQSARVVILINSMAKPHESKIRRLVLGQVDVLFNIAAICNDLFQHRHDGFIRSTVQGPP